MSDAPGIEPTKGELYGWRYPKALPTGGRHMDPGNTIGTGGAMAVRPK